MDIRLEGFSAIAELPGKGVSEDLTYRTTLKPRPLRTLDDANPDLGSGGSSRGFPECDQPAFFFIPQGKHQRRQRLEQSETVQLTELGKGSQHVRQAVEGDPAHKVVDVVNADVPGEPAQRLREFEIGIAMQSRLVKRPICALVPMGIFELVLDVEQPDPR
jgi:hypothetical protein